METEKLQLRIVVEELERAIERAEALIGAGPAGRGRAPVERRFSAGGSKVR